MRWIVEELCGHTVSAIESRLGVRKKTELIIEITIEDLIQLFPEWLVFCAGRQ